MDVPYDHIEDFADSADSDDELTVDIGGEEYTVEENVDFDDDGANDTAVVATEDGGAIAFADTDGDGVADVAVEYDADGEVVTGAEYDETTGEWHEEDVEALPTPSGDGADGATGGTETTGTTDPTGAPEDPSSTGYEAGEDDMTVDVPGEDVNAGPATYDTDRDGENDTAVVNGEDGTTYVFTDTDGDGEADEAAVITQEGDVTIASHTGDDEWTVVDEGHLNPDGTYESDEHQPAGAPS
ncbi:DUF6802 family protein [Actinophytocola glycyrrhizae]|uniref:DUF6802 family protein n=1 Tax=Actinophytocola glycyrrhizae TaxID=2044873 RepID=A0ABV9SC23_9PSEU